MSVDYSGWSRLPKPPEGGLNSWDIGEIEMKQIVQLHDPAMFAVGYGLVYGFGLGGNPVLGPPSRCRVLQTLVFLWATDPQGLLPQPHCRNPTAAT